NKIYNTIKSISNEYNYNILYHLSEAKRFEEITSIVTQDYFREQWFKYRNYKYILEDIKLTAKASYKVNKPECLFNCFISYSEINQRINNFFINNYTETFLDLNEIALANSFIFDATETLVSKENVMDYALNIYKKGYKELAFDLLKKAEPTYLIDYSKKVSPNRYDREQLNEIDEVDLILDWAKLKSLYFDLDNIFNKVQSLEIEFDDQRPNRDRNLLVETFKTLTDWFIDLEDWDKLRNLESYLELINSDNQFFFYFDIIWYLENNNDFYNKCINKLKNWDKSTINPVNKRLSLFHTIILKAPERGKYFFNELVSPKEIKTSHSFDRFEEGYLSYIFDYSRLYYITTQNFNTSPDFFVPTDKKQIITAYYKEFAELGKAFAYIYHNKKEAAQGFRFRFKQILNFFHYNVTDYEYEYSMQNNKSNLINLVLRISSKISNEVFNSILSEIETEWKNTKFWKDSDKQEVIELVIDLGLNKEWCFKHLNILDNPIFDDNDINSRIDKGITQIKLWNRINEISKAKQVLKTIMSISIDIQYEKEYHLDYMIDWLGKMDEIDDELISYVKSLDSIKYKTSHSSDYLTEQVLLHVLNKGNSLNFFKYLLFNKFINLNDGLEHLFGYFLLKQEDNKNLILKLFSRLVLNFDNSYSARHKFLEKLFSINPKNGELKKIVKEVNIHSILEHRNDYLFQIQEFAESQDRDLTKIGIEEKIISKKNTNTPSELRLQNKKSISFNDVLNQINSYDDICKLLEVEDKANSYFRWSKIITKKINILSDEEIENLSEKESFGISELVSISKHLFEHNRDKNLIKKLLYKGLDESSMANWDIAYDGASKLKAYELLNEVETTTVVSNKVFKDVSSNLGISSNRHFSILDRIFRLVGNNFSYEKYYPLIKEYKDLILQIHFKEQNIPSINGNSSDEDLLKNLLLFLIEIPSGYDDIIFEILIEEFQYNHSLIEKILEELYNNEFFLRYIKFLSGISLVNLKFVSGYVSEVTSLFNSYRYDIHNVSKRILERLAINYEAIFEPKTTSIPIVYKLEILHNPEIIISDKERMERLDETGHLRKTDDPLEYCHLYLSEIKKLSQEADIEIINIATRVKNLGEKNYKEPSWLKGLSEKEIRDIYEYKFELKTSYKRPQYQKVWCGLMMVLKELWELGLIDRGLADNISNSFDEHTFLIKPVKKPEFIPSIIKNERDYAPSTDEKWVYELNNDYLDEVLKFKINNGFYILAEKSIIEGQGDGLSSEMRQAYVEVSEIKDDLDKHYYIYDLSIKSYIKEYEHLYHNTGICIYNWIHYFGKKRNWLAINPRLANMMRLKPSIDGNFRWLDENGNIVVESIFWQNNYENNRSRNLHSESGYGWYVIISEEGIKRMKRVGINSLFHHKKVFRRLKFTQRNNNTYINEENSHWNITRITF
ncbi:hypothetical protein V2611_14250, partial [Tenacibaculum maritimum]|uniref:hypothetical protein n=1 Tax=Tenacibaculum maritimum TaxID=107401 RepID=UPI00387747E1